jgi:hypothetical protein
VGVHKGSTKNTTQGKIMCQTYADKIWAIHGERFGKMCTTTMVRTCTIDSLLTQRTSKKTPHDICTIDSLLT